ncbi:hypothetical protein ACLVWU_17550 [Bdellovibrio sp. HCB290]|uniref:hypothetical protein n=1 Tax=Bdellovibrio sp. HCB290 TaxID=3394356 RepID=UPI0039B636D0
MKNRNKFLISILALTIAGLFFQKKIEVDVSTAKASSVDGISESKPIPKTAPTVRTSKIPTAKSQGSSLDPENKDLLCKLKLARTNVPMQGNVQVFVNSMTPFFGNDVDNVAWIKSDSCPKGTYSIIHFSNDGRVSQEVDCRSSSLTEIATMSGEQGNIDDTSPKAGETSLAVVGNGYFVLRCPSRGLILTRDGKFQQGPDGNLVNRDGCTLLSQNGSSFQNIDINHSGCNSNGDCVGTIDPAFDDVYGLEYLNNYSFYAEDVGQLTESVTKKGDKNLRPSFFVNALEDVHNPERGLTSVSWSKHPHVNLNDIECP